MSYTFDSGALIAIERRKHRAVHLMMAARVHVPAPCVAEWWRGRTDRREDILRAVRIDWLSELTLRLAGEALASIRSEERRALAVDAIVMASAASRSDDIVVTSDPKDMLRLREFFPGVRVLSV
jgi:predicted nucleic acid-binding protein